MIQEEMLLDNFRYHLESFTLDEVLGVLEKMGKPIYYSSLDAHIKYFFSYFRFNDILGSISNRMKKSLTDITFVNKFHGLLTHLQKHDLIDKQQKNDHSHHSHRIKIESYEIKSQNISPLVKKFQKKIK